jgi:NitT/TauT family transport system ATP-binding protein
MAPVLYTVHETATLPHDRGKRHHPEERDLAFVELRDVGKWYAALSGRRSVAVQRFTLSLDRGDFLCLLGPSGCGKTTVLSMLAGFEPPSEGQILLDGAAVRAPSRDRGVVFQGDDSLYPWLTAVQNVEFGLRVGGVPAKERRATALDYLDLVGLNGQAEKFPSELSGGMKQRIQIARALANKPKMLLMDEPFGALDAQTRSIMQRELRRIWSATGTTIVFITHDIDEAILLSTRVGVMTAGPGGTLKSIIPIEMAGDRERTDPAYGRYYERVHADIRDEVAKASGYGRRAA